MESTSKNTLAISYNGVVSGFTPRTGSIMPSFYQFTEGVWNAPPMPYGDSVLPKGKLETVVMLTEFVLGLDRRIDQALIYAGSLRAERRAWLQEAVKVVRGNNPDCELLIFVCACAQGEPEVLRRLMAATNTDVDQWFGQDHLGGNPYFEGHAPNIGNNPIWYSLMVTRRYGQVTMKLRDHLHRLRVSPPPDEPGIATLLGAWLMRV